MAEHSDMSYWEMAYGAVAGLIAGAGTIFGINQKSGGGVGLRIRADVRRVEDAMLEMQKDIEYMQKAHTELSSTLERLEHEHDAVIAELFKELKQIGLALREVAVEVRFALNKGENK